MFSDIMKHDITIYTYNDEKYERTVLTNCIISEDVEVVSTNSSIKTVTTTSIQIPEKYNYGYNIEWGISLGDNYQSSYIVKGVCNFIFPNNLTKREMSEEIRKFEKEFNYLKPEAILDRRNKSLDMSYIEVIC